MADPAIIILILATLAAGALIGAVGVLSAIGLMLNRVARAVPPAGQAHAMSHPDLQELEREAADTLRGIDEHLDTLQNAPQGRQSDAPAAGKGVPLGPVKAPCLRCLRARRALLRPLRAIFRP